MQVVFLFPLLLVVSVLNFFALLFLVVKHNYTLLYYVCEDK